MNIEFSASNTIKGVAGAQDFSIAIADIPYQSGATWTASGNDRDANLVDYNGGHTGINYAATVTDSVLHPGHAFINHTPDVVAVTLGGDLTRVADGIARVEVRTPVGSRIIKKTISSFVNSSMTDVVDSFVTGSLAKHIQDTIEAMIIGKTLSLDTASQYSTATFSTTSPAATRNPNIFTGALDLSAIGFANIHKGVDSTSHPGILVSPRHMYGARHFKTTSPVVFMRPDGSFQTVNITGRADVTKADGVNLDVTVFHLSAAVTGITPMKIFPTNIADYLPGLFNHPTRFIALARTMHTIDGSYAAAQIHLIQILHIADTPDPPRWCTIGVLYPAARNGVDYASPHISDDWSSGPYGGDSGGPVFVVVNSELVLLCTFHTVGISTHASFVVNEVNAAMNSLATAAGDPLAGTYALSHPDLSGFTSFA